MSSCGIGQYCGANNPQVIEPARAAAAPNSGLVVKSASCTDNSCASNTGLTNATGSGGSRGNVAAYQRAGCSTGTCGSKAAAKTSGTCGTGGCGEEASAKKAQKAGCESGQCGGKKGLFKATIMTVAASELSQLTIDYSQYLS